MRLQESCHFPLCVLCHIPEFSLVSACGILDEALLGEASSLRSQIQFSDLFKNLNFLGAILNKNLPKSKRPDRQSKLAKYTCRRFGVDWELTINTNRPRYCMQESPLHWTRRRRDEEEGGGGKHDTRTTLHSQSLKNHHKRSHSTLRSKRKISPFSNYFRTLSNLSNHAMSKYFPTTVNFDTQGAMALRVCKNFLAGFLALAHCAFSSL